MNGIGDDTDCCGNCGYYASQHPVSPELQCPGFKSTNATSAMNNVDAGELYGWRRPVPPSTKSQKYFRNSTITSTKRPK